MKIVVEGMKIEKIGKKWRALFTVSAPEECAFNMETTMWADSKEALQEKVDKFLTPKE